MDSIIKGKPTELFKAIADADKISDYFQELSLDKNKDLIQENELEEEQEYEK